MKTIHASPNRSPLNLNPNLKLLLNLNPPTAEIKIKKKIKIKNPAAIATFLAFSVWIGLAAEISLESAPPVVVKTVPVAGVTDVDPALAEIKVTYSKAMQDGSWSWSTWGEENFPEAAGKPRYLADGRTCVLPVKLQPGKFYAIWLNSDKFKNFKDAGGRPAVPYLLTFSTSGTVAQIGGRDEAAASRPMDWLKEVNVDLNQLDPQNALLTQVMIEDLQPNGSSRFRNVIRTVNRGNRPQAKLQFQNSDFVDLQRLVDADGNSIPFTTVHHNRHFQYSAALTEPVPPGGALIYGSEGTTRGKVNYDTQSGTYSYRFSHSPGSGTATRRVEIHRLPQGAKLLDVALNATVRESKEPNGRPEVFLDQIVEPGGSVTLAYSYRLSDTGLSGPSSGGVLPPKVVSITPANGATDVDPALTEIKVVFDQPMMDRSWSMTGGGAHFPEVVGDIRYDDQRTTWIAPVKLKPGWRYEFGLNSKSYRNFKSEKGVSLEPVWVTFVTGGGSDNRPLVEREVNALVKVFPAPVDLSTPEGACAAWQRATAARDAKAISLLSLIPLDPKEQQEWFEREGKRDPEGLAVYLKAVADSKIIAVQIWREELASVITSLPFPEGKGRHPYSARTFGRVNGEWKNLGEDRLPDLESAKKNFEQKKENLWAHFQGIRTASKPQVTSDNVAVEDLALRILAAIRDKEDNVLKELAVDRIKGWRDALPQFAFELRERVQQGTGRPFALRVGESLVDGDYAAVKCTGPAELEGKYLVLFFAKTKDGWRNCSLRNSPPSTPLNKHLADCVAEMQKLNTTAGKTDAEWQRWLNDDQRAVVAWTDRQFRSYFDQRTFDGWSDEERGNLERKLIDALNGPRSTEYYQAIGTLAALRSTKALPRLREIAFERVDRNNRDRWMCVRALGLIGDKESVPELVHLVYHGNQNTHWWAQISLVRLTGQNFGRDWNAWGKWWNDQKGEPAYQPEIIRWWNGQPEPDKLAQALEEGDQKFLESIKPK